MGVGSDQNQSLDAIEVLLSDARRPLWKAFVGLRGEDGADDAVAEALAWGWENRQRLTRMNNPVGYLYRVGLTRTATRLPADDYQYLPPPIEVGLPDIEPALVPALQQLPFNQRAAVWLIHGCRWSYAETAEALGIGRSTVGTHVSRGMQSLRQAMEVTING